MSSFIPRTRPKFRISFWRFTLAALCLVGSYPTGHTPLWAQEQAGNRPVLSFKELSAQDTPPENATNPSQALAQPIPLPVAEPGMVPEVNTGCHFMILPKTLLWDLPLANHLQPRMYIVQTSLSNDFTHKTLDTAIGGEVGFIRYGPEDKSRQGVQLDFFAVVLSRWAAYQEAVESDYRVGVPLTFAWGNWQARLGYEHTSTHLGDNLIEQTGRPWFGHIRDEAVFGLSYRFWDQIRLYGVFAYSIKTSRAIGDRRNRFDWGVEWSKQQTTDWKGQPFAAFDMEIRQDQDYVLNTTFQIGWQWKDIASRASLRLALELYNGNSPFGQFFTEHEQWIGVGAYLDF